MNKLNFDDDQAIADLTLEIEKLKQRREIVKAFKSGKTIQVLDKDKWIDVSRPFWNWLPYGKYRVKPDRVDGWVNVYEDWISSVYPTEWEANLSGLSNRIKVAHVREVEE